MDHYDDERRALARCEADYLTEPEHSECDVCGAPLDWPDTRCDACDGVRVRRSDSVEGMPAHAARSFAECTAAALRMMP